jgi:hypothetical protein
VFECCPASWIGDEYEDCADQAYGCDLTCYECDGGDCGDGSVVVTYNVYRDGAVTAEDLSINSHTDAGLANFQEYEFSVSAVYPDGEESELSNSVLATPFPDTVHEEGYDDGSFETVFNAGPNQSSAVRFTADASGENILRFKWFQVGNGGAFFIKIFADNNGAMPGEEIYSSLQAAGNVDGWNEKDLSMEDVNVSGDFWIGTKEFSSSQPFGLDLNSISGNSGFTLGPENNWLPVAGDLGYRVFLDCGDCDDDDCPSTGSQLFSGPKVKPEFPEILFRSKPKGCEELNSLVPIQKSPETFTSSIDRSFSFQPSTLPAACKEEYISSPGIAPLLSANIFIKKAPPFPT